MQCACIGAANQLTLALSGRAMEEAAVELWPGGARARIFLDHRPTGPLAGMLYLPPNLDGRPDRTNDALLVFTVVCGRVSIKLERPYHSSEERDDGTSTTEFCAGKGSVCMVPPSSTYCISNKFDAGAQLSFLVTPPSAADVGTAEHRS
jgi:hypothetical protein